MGKVGLLQKIGDENLCANIDDALKRARELLAERAEAAAARHPHPGEGAR